MEARLQLEPGLLRLGTACHQGKPRAYAAHAERIDKVSPDDRDLNELWDSAHRAIAEAAGNRLMLGLFDAIDAVRREPGWHLRISPHARTCR